MYTHTRYDFKQKDAMLDVKIIFSIIMCIRIVIHPCCYQKIIMICKPQIDDGNFIIIF